MRFLVFERATNEHATSELTNRKPTKPVLSHFLTFTSNVLFLL